MGATTRGNFPGSWGFWGVVACNLNVSAACVPWRCSDVSMANWGSAVLCPRKRSWDVALDACRAALLGRTAAALLPTGTGAVGAKSTDCPVGGTCFVSRIGLDLAHRAGIHTVTRCACSNVAAGQYRTSNHCGDVVHGTDLFGACAESTVVDFVIIIGTQEVLAQQDKVRVQIRACIVV